VVYLGSGKVEVQSIDYPELNTPQGKKVDHGVIIKPITTNICGSDQHMVRGRTTAPPGLVLGHSFAEFQGHQKPASGEPGGFRPEPQPARRGR
jgi:threonine dehydrogenase-like Zn-dependent dehydrogenase